MTPALELLAMVLFWSALGVIVVDGRIPSSPQLVARLESLLDQEAA